MAKEKVVNLNFFQLIPLTPSSDETEKKEKLDAISNMFSNIANECSLLRRSDSNVTLHGQIQQIGQLHLGTLVNNQINDIPPGYTERGGIIRGLPLADDEGLGYPTSFLFDPNLRILMIESVRNGVGVSAFCKFFEQNCALPSMEAAVVLNPKELEKFYNMTVITKFRVKIARLQSGTIFKSKKSAIGQITQSADETNTDNLEYILSVNRGSDTLSLSKIRNLVRDFLGYKETEEVVVLSIIGKEEDEDAVKEEIDFIKQRLRETINVPRQRLISSFAVKEKYHMLIDAYDKHKQALQIYRLKKIQ